LIGSKWICGLRLIGDAPLTLANELNNLGTRLQDLGRLTEAEAAIREALEIEEPRLAPDDLSLSITLSNLAGIQRERKEFEKAETLYLRVAGIRKAAFGEKSAEHALSLSNLGTLYGWWSEHTGEAERMTQARQHFTNALAITEATRGERHPETATRHNNLATLKSKIGDTLGAVAEAEQSLAIRLSLDLMMHRDTHAAVARLICYLEKSGDHEKAERIMGGDFSDLFPAIAEVEGKHRAWVAEDPNNRDFGPPSRFGG